MCKRCGCDTGVQSTATNLQTGELSMLHGSNHDHLHEHGSHIHYIDLGDRLLAKNDAFAAKNRAWLEERNIFAVNLMSAPGAGKTTLLERTIANLKEEVPIYVIEGDQATLRDGERVHAAGAHVLQLNTGSGCHLDAHMIAHALSELAPTPGSLLFIENVGNLVCPALFDLGERYKVAVFSITEGADKPLKYPHMFRASHLIVMNKMDLLSYVDFDLKQAMENADGVNPGVPIIQLSATLGDGLDLWFLWLRSQHCNTGPAEVGAV